MEIPLPSFILPFSFLQFSCPLPQVFLSIFSVFFLGIIGVIVHTESKMEEEAFSRFLRSNFSVSFFSSATPFPNFFSHFFCLFPWNHRCDCLTHTQSKMEEEAFLNFLHSNSSVSLTRITLILI